ncbi:sodium/proline symporter PutP [Kiritimatiellota bacterium B12222]|nr:sodium/proline symporter PutP [Kiritimatiellota bacterium B12222]
MNADFIITCTFFVYLSVMVAVGWLAYRRTNNLSDYILGGRNLGPWATAISAGASDMSAWLLMGLPGAAYISGISAVWIAVGLLLGTWLNWRWMAPRLRVYTFQASDSLTLPEFLEHRFHTTGHALRLVSAAFILFFFLFYTASGLVAGGKLFETVFGVPYPLAVCIGTFAIISYTILGGFLAVCWTDLIQGLMMAAALLVLPIVAIGEMGGIGNTLENIQSLNPHLLQIRIDAATGNSLQGLAVISSMAWGLGYFGQPHILARFSAIRSLKDLPTARRIAVTWTGITLICSVLIGLIGFARFGTEVADPESIFMLLVNSLFHPVIAGILLAAILAAVMSTADSQLLVCSAAFTEDITRCLLRRDFSQKALVRLGRLTVVVIAGAAMFMALRDEKTVLALVGQAWAGFGATFGPVLLFSLYWKRCTATGAISGMITGGLIVILWGRAQGGLFDLYEIVPGFFFSCLAILIGSYLSPPPSPEIEAEFLTMSDSCS